MSFFRPRGSPKRECVMQILKCCFCLHRMLRHRLLAACWMVAVAITPSNSQDPDPYSKTFDDFEWVENQERVDIPGSIPLGQKVPTQTAIHHFEQRVKASPDDYMSLTFLGQLYLRQAKETDDWSCYQRAENSLEKSLQILPSYPATKIHLAEVYAAQHRFDESLQLALDVYTQNPTAAMALAIVSDCQLELGRYDEAQTNLAKLYQLETSAPVIARLARFAELNGETEKAISLMDQAIADLDATGALPEESIWFLWRKGMLLLGSGQASHAEDLFEKALAIDGEDAAVLGGLAEAQFALGKIDDAIGSNAKVVELYGAPPAMARLGDFYAALGRNDLAEQWHVKTERAMRKEQETAGAAHARELALFLADHNLHADEAVALARKDLLVRQDIYAYDTLAWCLYRAGQFPEAREMMNKALALGTQDAKLFSHAQSICIAVGEKAEAEQWQQRLIKLQPTVKQAIR